MYESVVNETWLSVTLLLLTDGDYNFAVSVATAADGDHINNDFNYDCGDDHHGVDFQVLL